MYCRSLCYLVLACGLVSGSQTENPDWDSLIRAVNTDPLSTWVAGPVSDRDAHRMLDVKGFKKFSGQQMPKYKIFADRSRDVKPPDSFDARQAWPNCRSIQMVRDQCGCGSCFAFGAVEAFEDRICIHLKKNVTLSVEDIISCHDDENMSCQGGNPIAVWQSVFAGRSAGDGAIQESCYPYAIPTCPCNHHSPNSSLPACPTEGTITTPTCDFTKKFACEDKGIFKSQPPTLIPAASMEEEIFTNGPITAAFTVFDDFLTYKSGVYQKSASAKALGGHSIKIIGYGVSSGGVKYWTVANSWNSEWGDGGFFKIKRGSNECFIESSAVVAGLPVSPPLAN